MKNEDWMPRAEDEDFASSLHQRTDELYRIPNAQPDDDGLIECPVLALRDLVVFPRMISPIFMPPGPSLLAIQEAQFNDMTVIGLSQKNAEIEVPDPEDLLPIGVEIAVGRLLNMPDGNNSALIQGRRRVEVVDVIQREPYIVVRARPIVEETDLDHRVEALMRATRSLFDKCVQLDTASRKKRSCFR
jgi:ATP-dependent Lon protease